MIADGDGSFLKVLATAECDDSDVIGVVHRTMDRDRLEAVGEKLESLRQWYESDSSFLEILPERPRGMGISVLKRRAPSQ